MFRLKLLVGGGALAAAGFAACVAANGAAGNYAQRPDLSAKDAKRVAAVVEPTVDFSKPEAYELMMAGAGTSMKRIDRNAFTHPLENLSFEDEGDFRLGNALFDKIWVSSPASTKASDGLGPLFNARSCLNCHIKGGRGHPPDGPDDHAVSMLLRLSIPPQTDADRAALRSKTVLRIAEPTYGGQLQDFAVTGLRAEGQMRVEYEEAPVELNGGMTVFLRKPTYGIDNLGYGPMHKDARVSPRVASPMIGLGLLEQIHENDILALADPDDADGDGISGKPNMVRDPVTGELTIGRFGWKATTPNIEIQSAEAFSGDIGLASPLMPSAWGDCTQHQPDCRTMPDGVQTNLGDTETPNPVLPLVTYYSRNLAVPARRDVGDPQVLTGKRIFHEAGCAACHRPKFVTRRDAPQKTHRFQLIWPYSDMLLHDMGDGLADNRPVGDASGREWRTAPLWGIGLTKTVNGHTNFLHDGRARNLLEAILWHGGEGRASREAVVALEPEDRSALIRFLESL